MARGRRWSAPARPDPRRSRTWTPATSALSPSTIADPSISPRPVPSSPSPTSATTTAGSPPGNSPIPSPVTTAHPSSHHLRPLTGGGYLTVEAAVTFSRQHWRACSGQVLDRDAVPVLREVLSDQPAVAVVRLVLAAEQDGIVEQFPRDSMLNVPLPHEFQELVFVPRPARALLLVIVEHGLRRRQVGPVNICHAAELIEEVPQVVPFGETRQLRAVVQ